MALGGGAFTVMNKELPGTYVNFVSAASAGSALSSRGVVTMPLVLDWGVEGEVFEVSCEDFLKHSLEIFGYEYGDKRLKGLRELFLNASKLYAYRINSGGEKAQCGLCEAVYGGVRGNDIMVSVGVSSENSDMFEVKTLVSGNLVDFQTVASLAELRDNAFVRWKEGAELSQNSGQLLTGGTNGSVSIASHQRYLDKIECFGFNAMGAAVKEEELKSLYGAFNKRMRDEAGIKFQLVLYRKAADYLGVINVVNEARDEVLGETGLVYWITGACGGCEVNRSNQNKIYDGELDIDAEYTQSMLKNCVKKGELVLHRVGSTLRILDDINSMVSVSENESEFFKDNQTVRVMDQIACDIAAIFSSKYLGTVPNDKAGRISLWSDIVKHHEQLREIRAIEDFSDSDIKVRQGENKKSVIVSDAVMVLGAMGKVYMTVRVS